MSASGPSGPLVLHMIILLLIQYFGQMPLSRKNMYFNINYIVSVPPFCTSGSTKWWNRDYVVDIEVHAGDKNSTRPLVITSEI